MNLWKKSRPNYSSDEVENAEMLEVYTRWLKGEKLSRRQKRLLKLSREDTTFGNLKPLIDFAHHRFRETESVIPRLGAKQRIADEVMRRIGRRETENLSSEAEGIEWQPAYSIDPVGSDSELANPPSVDYHPPPPEQVDPFAETVIIEREGEPEGVTLAPVEGSCNLKVRTTQSDELEQEYNIAFKEIIIGRSVEATIQLKTNAAASRRHALLTAYGDNIYITDLGSGNGTYVNGVRISEPTRLQVASTIAIVEQLLEVSEIRREEGTLRLSLTEIEGEDVGQVYTVYIKEITVGRGRAACLRFSDLAGTLSRLHARFELKNGEIYLTDLDSTNGVYVDGVRIEKPTVLKKGTTVQLGSVICDVIDIEHASSVSV
jgi:pSer/pThr/pTyr-binding forkhead associated (FHA) protein